MDFWRRHNVITGVVGALSWACSVVLPIALNVANADPVVQEAAKGRDTGANFLLKYQPPTVVDAPPPADPADYLDAGGKLKNEVWSRELFPGYDPGDPAQLDALKTLKDAPEDLATQGIAKKIGLAGGADETSQAYQALGAAAANPTHAVTNMRAEPFLDVSREIVKGESAFLDEILMACNETVTAGAEPDKVVHLEDIVSCSQAPLGAATDCTVSRNFVLEAVETKTVLTVSSAAGAPAGGEHWADFGLSEPIAGEIAYCSAILDEFGDGGPSGPYDVMMTRFYEIRPWPEPEWGEVNYYSNAYCGTHAARTPAQIESACTRSANALEGQCRNLRISASVPDIHWYGGGSTPCPTASGFPYNYAGCQPERQPWCEAARQQHYDACMGNTVGTPMNGTTTLTASATGAATNQVGVALLGTTVNITETTFDLAAHGIPAGEYVIASHVVNGAGITSHTIVDGGSNGTNWDYRFDVTAANSAAFTVEATLYRITANDFSFAGCAAGDLANIASGSCVGTVTCTDTALPCRNVNGVQICEAPSATDGVTELLRPWSSVSSPSTGPLCWSTDVRITECAIAHDCIASGDCAPSCADLPPELQPECAAPACWIDANGEEICLDSTSEHWVNNLGEPGYVDDCADEVTDPECVLRPERPCVEGMEDPANPGGCLLRQVFFDCGKDVTVPSTTTDTRDVKCAGDFRCFGDECAGTAPESNPDFAKAATASTMITEASKDISCAVEGDPSSCRLFEGSVEKCRDLQGSWLGLLPDCCKDARAAGKAAGSFSEYMQLAKLTYELAQKPVVASYLSQSSVGTAINSAIGPGGPLAQATGAVKSAISSGFNSAMQWAGFTPVEAASEASNLASSVATSATGFGPIQSYIATGVKNFLTDIGMDAFGDSLFSSTAEGIVTDWATSGIGQMIGSIISFIGWVYLIYQIVKIIASLIFKCKESELSFGIQLNNRMCHYVGSYCSKRVNLGFTTKCLYKTKSYCCFSSPLSRIMVEQLRAQGIGPAWGTGKRPNCEGIEIENLETVNWSEVDLSEWEAILFEAGLVPDPRNPPTNFTPTSIHAGDATGGTGEGVDSVTLNRQAIEAVMPTMDEGRFLLKTEPMNQADPELMPWYE
jgi:hypothetical protein